MTETIPAAPVRVRIAPSPTGDPHVGTAYIGLLNFLFARQRSGQFVLRIEDTDRTRFVPTSEAMIFSSLRWLGLSWDEGPDVGGPFGPYRQSERTDIYRQHAELLLANGHAYRAFETPEELDAERKTQMAAKQPPRYVGRSRDLTPEQIQAELASGKPFVVRLRVPQTTADGTSDRTTFRDELRGDITFEHSNVDDQVLLKSDGYPTYHLANVVDDHLMGISDVIRAEEWISSTPKHVLLYQAFGWAIPRFWHMPLLRNTDKSKISKRKNPVSLLFYQESGFLPEAMLNFLGLMGGGMPHLAGGPSGNAVDGGAPPTVEPGSTAARQSSAKSSSKEVDLFTLADMLERFRFEKISLGGPVFDLTKLRWLNGEYLRRLSPDHFYAALRSTVLSDRYLQGIAALTQNRIETLAEFGNLNNFFLADNIVPPQDVWLPKKRSAEDTLAFAAEQLLTLEATPWEHDSIESALKALGESKGWSVKENFMLLRAIITGSLTSPPLIDSMLVFGKPRTVDRVRRFINTQGDLAKHTNKAKSEPAQKSPTAPTSL